MNKFIKASIATVMLLGVGFVGGFSSAPVAKAPTEITQVAQESSPGPTGSGVLGDWTPLSHGVYCFQPPASKTKSTSWPNQKSKVFSATVACAGEDVRVYGDSILNGGRNDLALNLFDYNKTVLVDAWSGRPTTPVADAIDAETWLPKTVVVLSGTNDIFNASVMGAQIRRIQNRIAYINAHRTDGVVSELYWGDVQATRWGQTDVIERNDQRNSMAVNLAIYQNVPVDHIIQWTQRFMTNPSLIVGYLVDGVHPKQLPLNSLGRPIGYDYWAGIVTGWLHSLGGI